MKMGGSLLKTPLKKRWFQAGLACLIFTASAGAVQANPTISINARNAVRTADGRWFGINTGDWDTDFNLQDTVPELTKAGWQTLRFPGGSDADHYHWYLNTTNNSRTYQGKNSVTSFAAVATNIGANVIIIANYGSGTAAEAAGWVAYANVTNHWGFKYWEIGNECYGTYETDSNTYPHDPYTYATRVADYAQQMKAVDPTIKIGVVAHKDPTADSNGYTNHPATNLVTGVVYYGWFPVVLSTLSRLGVTPDFAIYHYYPQNYPFSGDNDQTLLAKANWAGDAADLRGQITDFFGPGGTNIELLVTENNCDAGTPGKQSVSLVNGLYYANSLGQLIQTEFNARVWFDLHAGTPPFITGDLNDNLYGWRMYGDLGVMWYENLGLALTNRYPPYFAAELISHFIRAGDTVLNASCDNALVSAYAALRTNGSLTLMAINKSPTSNYLANIVLTNYLPGGTATVYSYGMPQDNAAQAANNSACDIATNSCSVRTNFNYTLAPYSITVFAFASTPLLSVLPPSSAGQVVLQLAGQPGVPYVLQTSTDLSDWTSVATNTLTGNVLDITNPIISGAQFWRAAWLP
ncbi:MAG: alpha-L-arabinofuranosidase [Verrucomicrobiota bacterium]|jgi:hypothetical protein